MDRKENNKILTEKELKRKIHHIDKIRSQTREMLFSLQLGKRDDYHLTINTTDGDINELSIAVSDFINCWFKRK